MDAVKPIEDQIIHYLAHLNTQQKEVVLSVVKSFAVEEENWGDQNVFAAEIVNRFSEMETGKVKLYTLEEIEIGARRGILNRKR